MVLVRLMPLDLPVNFDGASRFSHIPCQEMRFFTNSLIFDNTKHLRTLFLWSLTQAFDLCVDVIKCCPLQTKVESRESRFGRGKPI